MFKGRSCQKSSDNSRWAQGWKYNPQESWEVAGRLGCLWAANEHDHFWMGKWRATVLSREVAWLWCLGHSRSHLWFINVKWSNMRRASHTTCPDVIPVWVLLNISESSNLSLFTWTCHTLVWSRIPAWLFFSLIYYFIWCVYGRSCVHTTSHVWSSEDNLWELALFFNHAEPGNRTQVVSFSFIVRCAY